MDLAEASVFGRALGAIARLQAGLTPEQRQWLGTVPVRVALDAVDAMPEGTDFTETTAQLEAVDATVSVECDPAWTGPYWNLVLLHLVVQRFERGWPFALPPDVRRSVLAELERIAVDGATRPQAPDPLADGGFMLDLGFARGRVVPFGLGLAVAPVFLPNHADDDRPWMLIHLSGRRADDITDAYAQLEGTALAAQFFRANPSYGGMFGPGWLADPQVGEVSPHLAIVRQMLVDGGATIVPLGSTHPETIEQATSTSRTRRRRYEEGSWTPRHYLVRWPRENFLRWAADLGITE